MEKMSHMPSEQIITDMEKFLNIASDKTRLKIMFSLLDESKCCCGCNSCGGCSHLECMIEKSVNDIVKDVNCSQSLVSHQLKVLKDAGYVSSKREGNKIFYSLKDGHIRLLLSVTYEHVLEEE